MTHRSRTQRLALLSASTALVTAGLLPSTTAFAAPAPAAAAGVAVTAAAAPTPTPPPTQPSQAAVKTTDPPAASRPNSPGRPRSAPAPSLDGKTVGARVYGVETPGGATGFAVYDVPGDRLPLEDALKGFVNAYGLMGGGTLTSENVRKTTVDGHPALDATLTGVDGTEVLAGSIRLISDDDHVIMALTFVPEENEKNLNAMHKQLLDSLQIP